MNVCNNVKVYTLTWIFTSGPCHHSWLTPATINTAGGADGGELHLRPSKSIDPLVTDVDGGTWHVCVCVRIGIDGREELLKGPKMKPNTSSAAAAERRSEEK